MAKPLIVIVEDERDIAELMRFAFEQQGYESKVFSTLSPVQQFVKKYKPVSLFMDISVQGSASTSLIKKIKSEKSTSSIPIILVSAQNALADTAKRTGADHFLTKPFDLKELLKFVPRMRRSDS